MLRKTLLEESSSRPESYLDIQRYAQQIQASPPARERLEVIRQLDAAVKASETGVEIALKTQLAVTKAVLASRPMEQRPSIADLPAVREQHRPQIQKMVLAQTRIALLYTYQPPSAAELAEYIAFASSEAGARYHDAAAAGFQQALLEGGYTWGRASATS